MKAPTHHFSRVRLQRAVIAFFILAALSLLVVYVADPAIYAHSLALTSSPADRYPVPVTLFLVGILAGIALLILGVMHHWRWVFWLMLVAFSGSALQIPVTLLQIADVLPSSDPLWYGLFRMGGVVVELALAVWMIHIYRHDGVWARGKKRHER
jgi:MFS family permease